MDDLEASLRRYGAKQRVPLPPLLLVLAAIQEIMISDLKELELLQVRVGDPPSALQVEVEPVTQDVT